MQEALRDESLENRTVIRYDLTSVDEDRRVMQLNMANLT
jgi:hypothetical protein